MPLEGSIFFFRCSRAQFALSFAAEGLRIAFACVALCYKETRTRLVRHAAISRGHPVGLFAPHACFLALLFAFVAPKSLRSLYSAPHAPKEPLDDSGMRSSARFDVERSCPASILSSFASFALQAPYAAQCDVHKNSLESMRRTRSENTTVRDFVFRSMRRIMRNSFRSTSRPAPQSYYYFQSMRRMLSAHAAHSPSAECAPLPLQTSIRRNLHPPSFPLHPFPLFYYSHPSAHLYLDH